MRYRISEIVDEQPESYAECDDIRDAVAILDRHPGGYIFDRVTGSIL